MQLLVLQYLFRIPGFMVVVGTVTEFPDFGADKNLCTK